MRALLAMTALAALLTAGPARAGDDSAPAASAELLKQMQETQAKREQAMAVPEPTEPDTVESHLAKGDAQRAEGDHARALWSYLMAHRVDRSDPRPIERIGTLHLSRDPERAEMIFRELVHRKEDSALARTGLGLALIARGAWSDAVVELRKAVDEDEALAATHNALGVALDHLKQPEAARWHYRRATELAPRSHEPLNNLGVSLLTGGDFESAAEAFEQSARLEPRDAAVWNNLGVARGRQGRYDEALEAFRKAGDELSAQNNLGYVRYLNGDYDGALAAYERALHAAGDPAERLPVLRNARAAQEAKTRPPAPPKPQASAPVAGSDAPGLGGAPGLQVEDVAPPAAMPEEPFEPTGPGILVPEPRAPDAAAATESAPPAEPEVAPATPAEAAAPLMQAPADGAVASESPAVDTAVADEAASAPDADAAPDPEATTGETATGTGE